MPLVRHNNHGCRSDFACLPTVAGWPGKVIRYHQGICSKARSFTFFFYHGCIQFDGLQNLVMYVMLPCDDALAEFETWVFVLCPASTLSSSSSPAALDGLPGDRSVNKQLRACTLWRSLSDENARGAEGWPGHDEANVTGHPSASTAAAVLSKSFNRRGRTSWTSSPRTVSLQLLYLYSHLSCSRLYNFTILSPKECRRGCGIAQTLQTPFVQSRPLLASVPSFTGSFDVP